MTLTRERSPNEQLHVDAADIGVTARSETLLRLSGLNEEGLLLEHRRVAVHQVSKRTKVVLIQESDGDLGLQSENFEFNGRSFTSPTRYSQRP